MKNSRLPEAEFPFVTNFVAVLPTNHICPRRPVGLNKRAVVVNWRALCLNIIRLGWSEAKTRLKIHQTKIIKNHFAPIETVLP
jgi:hypothetical protein